MVDNFLIREADHASRTYDPQQFLEQYRPIPGAHKTDSKPQINQIKGGIRKLEDAQRIHDVKLDAIVDVMSSGLGPSILDQALIDIVPPQRPSWIGLVCFNNHATQPPGKFN